MCMIPRRLSHPTALLSSLIHVDGGSLEVLSPDALEVGNRLSRLDTAIRGFSIFPF